MTALRPFLAKNNNDQNAKSVLEPKTIFLPLQHRDFLLMNRFYKRIVNNTLGVRSRCDNAAKAQTQVQ